MQDSLSSSVTRRGLLIGGGAALLAACTSENQGSGSTSVFLPPSGSEGTTSAPTSSVATDGTAALRILMPPDSIANTVFDTAAADLGVPVVVEVYADQAFVIDRLLAQQGAYQYDVIVVPGAFLPPAIENGLLTRLDHTLLPSLEGQLAEVRNSPFDPDSSYSVCKEVGYTGYAWDRTVIPDGISTWDEFITAAGRPEVSGKVTCLAEGAELVAIGTWAKGSRTPADFDANDALDEVRADLMPHLLDLDSGPSVRMHEGAVVLAQMWNGEGRRLVQSDPDRFGYAIGGPVTGVWMERCVIPATSTNIAGAHRFMELLMQPEVALAQTDMRGYNTGVAAIQSEIEHLERGDLIPVGDAMFGDTKDYGEVLLSASGDIVRELVVGVVQDLSGTAPTATTPSTSAPVTTEPITTEPPTTEAPTTTTIELDAKGRRVLRPQDTGTGVDSLQHRLVELGYSIGQIDAWYGDVTLAAVLAFQRSQGLQTDGVVGRYTWDALENPKPILSRDVNTRGVSGNAPSDASGHAPATGGSGGRSWVKAVIYLDSFRDEFFDAAGNLVATYPNSPGVNGLTPTGTFKVYSRSANTFYSKNPAETMKWMVRFNGGIGFHSVPRINGTPEPTPLGQAPSSHGCIRHADDVAKRIYDNLADGATVIVRHG